jgi:hypothetical protein
VNPVHRGVNVGVLLVPVHRENGLVLTEAPPLQKILHVTEHFLIGWVVVRMIPDRHRINRLLDTLTRPGRHLHLLGRRLQIVLEKQIPRLRRAHPLLLQADFLFRLLDDAAFLRSPGALAGDVTH